jgi:hypothetical protein
VTFVLPANYDDNFADQRVFDKPVLTRNGLTLITFHKLGAQDNNVAARFNKDTVTLHKLFVP